MDEPFYVSPDQINSRGVLPPEEAIGKSNLQKSVGRRVKTCFPLTEASLPFFPLKSHHLSFQINSCISCWSLHQNHTRSCQSFLIGCCLFEPLCVLMKVHSLMRYICNIAWLVLHSLIEPQQHVPIVFVFVTWCIVCYLQGYLQARNGCERSYNLDLLM